MFNYLLCVWKHCCNPTGQGNMLFMGVFMNLSFRFIDDVLTLNKPRYDCIFTSHLSKMILT